MLENQDNETGINLAPWQYITINNPFKHFCMFGGVAVGKSTTGAHWAIDKLLNKPHQTGLICANTYDQLSQSTLRELLTALERYEVPFVIDEQPPAEWGFKSKKFKSYRNVLSVYAGPGKIAHAFTRILSEPDALRGLNISWYWGDEMRDTDEYTHDMILARCRETDDVSGLITTTTNGEDWTYRRFCRGARRGDNTYGSMHVRTEESVKFGIITKEFYNILRKSYSPMMAAQELDALHVNIFSGRAYYAAGEENKCRVAPWGDRYPTPDRPLIIGCDFNFSPSPCIWMVGQVSPDGDAIHWFNEFARLETSTTEMMREVISQYGDDFFYKVYGDSSGNHGTTSNAGKTDYDQIGEELAASGCGFSIDAEQFNPRVKDRVENMNRLFKDGTGTRRQTYNPDTCPYFDGDVRMVGWKQTVKEGKGKLDNGGDLNRTHASDGAGYACYKLFPPARRGTIVGNVPSAILQQVQSQFSGRA